MSKVVVMQLLVEGRVSATLRQHDLQVEAHCVATAAVVDHRRGQLAIPTNTRNDLIIILCFSFQLNASQN